MTDDRKVINLPFSPEDVRTGQMGRSPRVYGIGRVGDNEQAVLAVFSRKLTDDELRDLHDYIRNWRSP